MFLFEAFGSVYDAFLKLVGNHGYAIFLLSFVICLILEPFRKLAEKLGNRDKAKRAVFEKDLSVLKKHYTGIERYHYIRTLYRLHGYHPIQSLYALTGLLVQIPFFVLAYGFFTDYMGYIGTSFWFIPDLSKPDGFLAGVHLLPLVMTAFNLATLALMFNTLSLRNDKVEKQQFWQLSSLAFLFLLVLYNAPSALVLYWTANNVFAFVREFFLNWKAQTAKLYHTTGVRSSIWKVLTERMRWIYRSLTDALDNPATSLVALFCGILVLMWLGFLFFDYEKRGHFKPLLPVLVFVCGFLMIYFARLAFHIPKNIFFAKSLALVNWLGGITFLTFFFYFLPNQIQTMGEMNIVLMGVILGFWKQGMLLFLGILITIIPNMLFSHKLFLEQTQKCLFSSPISVGESQKTIWVCTAVFFVMVWIVPAVNIIETSPDEFPERVSILSLLLFFSVVCFIVIALFCFLFQKISWMQRFSPLVPLIFFFVSTNALAQYYVLGGDYGIMDFFIFHDPAKLTSNFPQVLKDSIIIAVIFAICCFFLRFTKPKQWISVQVLALGVVVASLTLPLFSILQSTESENIAEPEPELKSQETNQHAESNTGKLEPKYFFSKNGKNVLVIFFDCFMGGFVPEILKDRPDLKQSLEGFVWYPNTLSFDIETARSLPAIHGGYHYTDVVKQRKKVLGWRHARHPDMLKTISESTGFTIKRFLQAGWDTFINDPKTSNQLVENWGEKSRSDKLIGNAKYRNFYFSKNRILQEDLKKTQENLKKTKADFIKITFQYLVPFGLFKTSPEFLRASIYNEGDWWSPPKFLHGSKSYINNLSLAFAWPSISQVSKTSAVDSGSYNFVTNLMTHDVYAALDEGKVALNRDQVPPSAIQRFGNKYTAVHFFAAKEALVRTAVWMDWLREQGIYNNTQVVIVSDHGRVINNPMLKEQIHKEAAISYSSYHALLMVKDFDTEGELSIHPDFMTIADVPSIVLSAIDPQAKEKYGYDKSNGFRLFTPKGNLTVHDNIFDPKNWVYTED